ncbi:uncharacterized protein LOC122859907 [Aphidius gifuensis]|uniref:uncharacterized protein LOC122859907 n=1 Tax=Aphidius gifuensis TaxID=684658 RepID=UPI001CDD5FEB|nr:uncharacterized protein LOC122859907 [Aphidius gifuensis]
METEPAKREVKPPRPEPMMVSIPLEKLDITFGTVGNLASWAAPPVQSNVERKPTYAEVSKSPPGSPKKLTQLVNVVTPPKTSIPPTRPVTPLVPATPSADEAAPPKASATPISAAVGRKREIDA